MMSYFSLSMTVRAGCAFCIAFICGMIFLPLFIRLSKRSRLVEKIKVETQLMKKQTSTKKNTPTMGGVVIVFSYLQAIIVCGDWSNTYLLFAVMVITLFAALGIGDDLIKTYTARKGLKARTKLVSSFLVAVFVTYLLLVMYKETSVLIPISNEILLLPEWLWYGVVAFVIAGASHGVNLTDGMDGLATGCSILVISFFSCVLLLAASSTSLEFLTASELSEITVSNFAMLGSCCAFLWFNCYPAQIFMGDCGALMLGGYIGYIAVVMKMSLLLAIVGGIFVIETLSSFIQIFAKKYFSSIVCNL